MQYRQENKIHSLWSEVNNVNQKLNYADNEYSEKYLKTFEKLDSKTISLTERINGISNKLKNGLENIESEASLILQQNTLL